MNLILFGPPGAGKGTQATLICKEFNLIQISTGDLLRSEIKKKTNLGKKIDLIINKGSLVSDNIVSKLLINSISHSNNSNKLVFDGYPRNIQQAKNLDKMLIEHKQKILCVLCLNVEKGFTFYAQPDSSSTQIVVDNYFSFAEIGVTGNHKGEWISIKIAEYDGEFYCMGDGQPTGKFMEGWIIAVTENGAPSIDFCSRGC